MVVGQRSDIHQEPEAEVLEAEVPLLVVVPA